MQPQQLPVFPKLSSSCPPSQPVAVAKLEFEANKARAEAAYALVCEEAETAV